MTALNNFNEQVRDFYQQAVDCARQADAQNDPKVKQQFLELPARRFPPPWSVLV
jgi:hypothetical protein